MNILNSFFICLIFATFFLSCGNQTAGKGSEKNKPQELTIGVQAPDFTLADQNGNMHTLSSYKGKNVVLYFYPKDDTPGCTKEACSFRDGLTIFKDLNTVILGVSVDDPESHQKFIDKYKLNFTLLSDVDKNVSKAYNALNMIGFSKRHTFLIDKEGVIKQIYRKVNVEQHSQEIRNFIKQNMI